MSRLTVPVIASSVSRRRGRTSSKYAVSSARDRGASAAPDHLRRPDALRDVPVGVRGVEDPRAEGDVDVGVDLAAVHPEQALRVVEPERPPGCRVVAAELGVQPPHPPAAASTSAWCRKCGCRRTRRCARSGRTPWPGRTAPSSGRSRASPTGAGPAGSAPGARPRTARAPGARARSRSAGRRARCRCRQDHANQAAGRTDRQRHIGAVGVADLHGAADHICDGWGARRSMARDGTPQRRDVLQEPEMTPTIRAASLS